MEAGDVVADRFEVERRIAGGGMGDVYRAVDGTTGEPVALKLLRHPEHNAGRFAREARLLAQLHHPGIVRYVAHGVNPDGSAWLAMEWLDGEDLASRLARSPLSVAESLEIARRAAAALAAAHERGVVHRDVKPANLFLPAGRIDRLKVLDFGVARGPEIGEPGQTTIPDTRTGTALGTPGYMAPEQARGERTVDARADVFALGCVLFECLTGRPVFVGEHPIAILAKILLEEAPRLDEVMPDAPPTLVDLLARMLAKGAEIRPPDGHAVARALDALDVSASSADPVVRSHAARSRALTTSEQRIFSVVLAAPDEADAEVIGAPTLAAEIAAEEVRRLREVAQQHGAELQRIAGGTLLCMFDGGAAADRAARCALALAAAVPLRIAVATGRALVEHALPIGDAIDSAASLLRAGAAGQVRLDAISAALLGSRFDVDMVDGSYVITRAIEHVAPVRTLLGRKTPCVGREREITTLEGYLRECIDDRRSRAVLVSSAPGMGKSRLCEEFVRRVEASSNASVAKVEVWTAYGDVARGGAPLSLLSQVIKRAASLQDGESSETRHAKLEARVARHVAPGDRVRVTEFLAEMIAPGQSDANSSPLKAARADHQLMADQMRSAWEDFVSAECSAHPVVVVVEDLQWGDTSTVRLIDRALEAVGERPCLVVAFARPEVHELFPQLWSRHGLEELRLGGLSRKASERIARAVLGEQAAPEIVERVVSRANGNAFFLEELIRAESEGRGDAVPETVLGMVEARLETLSVDARRVLRAASVFGATFWTQAVDRLLGDESAEGWLELLAQQEFLQKAPRSRFPEQREWAFRHDLVRVAAHAMLVNADRELGHRLAAEWLVSVAEPDALVIAEHFEASGEREKAAQFFLRAAQQALAADDPPAAIRHADRGVAGGATGELLGQLLLAQADALFRQGETVAIAARSSDALQHLREGEVDWFHALSFKFAAAFRLGSAEVAELALHAAGAAAAPGAMNARTIAVARTAPALLFTAHREVAGRLIADLRGYENDVTLAWILEARSILAVVAGDTESSVELIERAIRLYEADGEHRRAAIARANMAWAYTMLGEFESAEAAYVGALASAKRLGLTSLAATARIELAEVRLRRGDPHEALAMAARATADAVKQRSAWVDGQRLSIRAAIHLALNDFDAADADARSATQMLAAFPSELAQAFATSARISLARGDLAAAREADAAALAQLGTEEFRSAALVRVVHAKILEASGDHAGACVVIRDARARLVASASLILNLAVRKSCLTRVAEHAEILALARAWLGE